MKPPFGMPGIGASLGQCALCGDSFVIECCLGKKVIPFTFEGCENTLYAHETCIAKVNGELDVLTLPDKSPLRKAYESSRQIRSNSLR